MHFKTRYMKEVTLFQMSLFFFTNSPLTYIWALLVLEDAEDVKESMLTEPCDHQLTEC